MRHMFGKADEDPRKQMDRIVQIDESETRPWQPVDFKYYRNYADLPIFHIRLMSDAERRHWNGVIEFAAKGVANESDEVKMRLIHSQMPDQIFGNFVTEISNVKDPKSGKFVTLRGPDEVIAYIRKMPGSDGEALDIAIWNIGLLQAGEVKNSKSSPDVPQPVSPEVAETVEAGKDASEKTRPSA